jgi:hypothetical protein
VVAYFYGWKPTEAFGNGGESRCSKDVTKDGSKLKQKERVKGRRMKS